MLIADIFLTEPAWRTSSTEREVAAEVDYRLVCNSWLLFSSSLVSLGFTLYHLIHSGSEDLGHCFILTEAKMDLTNMLHRIYKQVMRMENEGESSDKFLSS